MESGISLVKQHFSIRDHLQKKKSQQRGVHKANSKQFLIQGRTITKTLVNVLSIALTSIGKWTKEKTRANKFSSQGMGVKS